MVRIASSQQRRSDQIEELRDYLLSCPGINPKSEVMKVALATFDEAKTIVFSDTGTHNQNSIGKELQYCNGASTQSTTPAIRTNADIDNYASTIKIEDAVTKNENAEKYEHNVHKMNQMKENKYVGRSILFKMMRSFFVDFPLVSLFIMTVFTTTISHLYDDFLSPQIDFMRFTDDNRTHDLSYYHRDCPLGQMSTDNVDDLIIDDDFTTEECEEHMMVHGMSIYKNIISPETANALRTYVLDRNKNLKAKDEIGVIENENRWSFGIGANDHPSVSKALNEIATHEVLRPALEKIAGKNPAMIEMTAITAAYGALDQEWHPDVVSMGSPAKYVTKFVPSYALFITLQDTSAEMGATEICPGTYMCGNDNAHNTCLDYGFKVSGKNNLWRLGDGLLMNQQSFHRGAAHIDPYAPHRVVFIITFSPRPIQRGETRMLGQGGSYSLRWDMWGHTLNDLEHAPTTMVQPWTTLRALGIYKPSNADWGWDLISQHSMRAANSDTGYGSANEFKGTLIGIPPILLADDDVNSVKPQQFFRLCIQKWRRWALYANVAAIILYTLGFVTLGIILIATHKNNIGGFSKGFFFTIVRVATLYSIIAGFAYYTYQLKVVDSIWGREISTGTFLSSPYTVSDKLDDFFQRETLVIKASDVLVTDRFNVKHLSSLAEIPKYHPGNMKLRSVIQGASDVSKILKPRDVTSIARIIVANSFRDGSNFAFLNDDAIWVPLRIDEAENYVLNAIFLEANPIIATVYKEAAFLLSFYRYGHLRRTTLASKHSPVFINALMDQIFAQQGIPNFKLFRHIHATYTISEKKSESSLKSSFHVVRHYVQPLSMSIKNKSSVRIPSFQQRNTVTPIMLQKGSLVEGQYNGAHNEVSIIFCLKKIWISSFTHECHFSF
jgi:hypothetical protein